MNVVLLVVALSACRSADKGAQEEANINETTIETNTMKDQSFTTTLQVDQTPAQVFNAITNVRGWWSEEIEGGTARLNDEFIYHYQDIHITKMKLVEVVPDERVVWHVLENYFNFIEDQSEWKDTKIIFEISRNGSQTQLKFTHLGLVPDYECYGVCRDGWTNYINNSLAQLITTGKGTPNTKEGGFNAELAAKWNLN